MWLNPLSASGTVLLQRYRLEERLSGPDPLRGSLWRAVDVMAGDLPGSAIRQLNDLTSGDPFSQRLQGVWPDDADAVASPVAPLRSSWWSWMDGVMGRCATGSKAADSHRFNDLRARRQKAVQCWMRFCCCCARCLPVLAVCFMADGLVHGAS